MCIRVPRFDATVVEHRFYSGLTQPYFPGDQLSWSRDPPTELWLVKSRHFLRSDWLMQSSQVQGGHLVYTWSPGSLTTHGHELQRKFGKSLKDLVFILACLQIADVALEFSKLSYFLYHLFTEIYGIKARNFRTNLVHLIILISNINWFRKEFNFIIPELSSG